MQRLTPEAARQWAAMQAAAAADGITLLIVSGYRSIDYQARLIRKKLNAGQSLSEILEVNAAPGHSEHHTGRAIDIASPGSRPLTEEFERSEAFAWLGEHAGGFGFVMSYPRGNPAGFIYEPWHWALKD
jgi:D-alanyl-D-alanine carboxypeptidase